MRKITAGLTQRKILELVKNNSRITTTKLAELVGVSVTSINNEIKKLKEKNMLKREGSNKSGIWVII